MLSTFLLSIDIILSSFLRPATKAGLFSWTLSIFAGVNGYLDKVKVEYINQFENNLIEHCRNKQKKLLETIQKDQEVKESTEKQLHQIIKSFLNSYKKEELVVEDKKEATEETKDKEVK